MPDGQVWWVFIPASLALIIVPGPDLLFLLSQGIQRGRAAGLATALGLASGNLVHTLGATLGVSIIFRTSAVAFATLKFAGVAYLLYLAWQVWKSAGKSLGDSPVVAVPGHAKLFRRGFLMNVLNPKVALFFLAFLPQFAKPEAGSIAIQMALLGGVFTLLVVVVFGMAGWFAGTLRPWLLRRGKRMRRVGAWFLVGVYCALAVRLALATR
ncbi:LysE family translocator [Acidihalobacter ferrooxydans]|uniref:Threonine transporter RhtB n=1 Tax=Acidihalobacter ferrooxydans TaxID=1765967 RepID=A0A1P8UEM9_9GAMM|nr:LysE family translocator [Acidihalobacter ferrooxydans]APZ42224.1 hypothetical protein BW247_03215 [Acidihalobacter ferrooxydans]